MISQSIGWTLVHSVWQGLGVYMLLKIGMRLTSRADVRYGIGVAALGLIVMLSIATFLVLNTTSGSEGFNIVINTTAITSSSQPVIQTVFSWIDTNIIWLLRFWTLGLVAGLLRIAAGLWYINRLRRNANPVQGEWIEVVKSLSSSLNITRVVMMAEAAIASPMVVGFMKPMILFPAGLLSGLTMEQVETILVHELSHIRRQDYIVNLVQSVIETVFFFNPFVLLISALIREERENCCDDLVIAKGVSPITYVKTLAQLEAAKSSSSLALGIAGNQNQLLNRIKRIMENSAKNDWGKGRLVPVALLFLGLICASWLSIGSEKTEKKEIKEIKNVVLSSPAEVLQVNLSQDTSKKDGLTVVKRKTNNHGQILEEYEEIPMPPDMVEIIEIPDMPDAWHEMPVIPGMFNNDDFKNFQYEIFDTDDSIPAYTFRLRTPEDWEQFEADFKDKFKAQFKDFYDKNQKQFDKMLEEMKRAELSRDEARSEAARVVDLARIQQDQPGVLMEIAQDNRLFAEQQLMQNKMQYKDILKDAEVSRQLAEMAAKQQAVLADQYRQSEEMYSDMTRRYSEFQKALTEQLIADGYVKSSEEVQGLNINDNNGELTINGKKIKEKDRVKYKALQDQYLKTKRAQMIPGRSE